MKNRLTKVIIWSHQKQKGFLVTYSFDQPVTTRVLLALALWFDFSFSIRKSLSQRTCRQANQSIFEGVHLAGSWDTWVNHRCGITNFRLSDNYMSLYVYFSDNLTWITSRATAKLLFPKEPMFSLPSTLDSATSSSLQPISWRPQVNMLPENRAGIEPCKWLHRMLFPTLQLESSKPGTLTSQQPHELQ